MSSGAESSEEDEAEAFSLEDEVDQADDESRSDEDDASDDGGNDDDDDGDDFTLESSKKKKRKRQPTRKSTTSRATNKKKKTASAKDDGSGAGEAKETIELHDEDMDVIDLGSDSPPPTSAAPRSKKPTAAQRRKSALKSAADDALSASQEARDAAFRAFATAPVSAQKSSHNDRGDAPPLPRPPPAAAASAPTTTAARDTVCTDDDDDVMEIAPFVPSVNKTSRHHAPAAAAAAASAWGSIGLGGSAAPAAKKNNASKAKPKSKSTTSADQDECISLVQEIIGGASVASADEIARYLENAEWNVEVAVDRILSSAWFSGGASGRASQPAAASVPQRPKPTNNAADVMTINDDEDDTAASSSRPATASRPSAAKKNATAQPSLDSSLSVPADFSIDFSSPVSTAPPAVAPDWDRKLLLILNVSGQSTTAGRNLLQAGDIVDFQRERFDPVGWSDQEREKEMEDAAANAAAIAAASAATSGKKKAPAKSKAKQPVPLISKRPTRILRFRKKDAPANSLEIGSVPQILTQIIAPLFDAHFIDLESSVLYCPPVVDFLTTITLSMSVYVRPSLFLYTPPPLVSNSPQTDNPFWRRIFAKKDAAAGAAPSHRWNPVEAFCRLLRECEVQPVASTEMELDEATTQTPMEEAHAAEEESKNQLEAASAAASSSAAPALVEPVYEEELEEAKAARSTGGGGSDGATVSRFQLESLYASAAVATRAIPEADAPPTFKAQLRPYQRQALHWMQMREAGDGDSKDVPTDGGAQPTTARRHALWDEYAFADPTETRFYVNPFSHELSLAFPPSTGSCRGGLLCDEMGMGKTAMMIALMLANHPANVILDTNENEEVERDATDTKTKTEEGEKEEENSDDVQVLSTTEVAPSAPADSASSAPAPAASSASASAPSSSAASAFFSLDSSRARHRRRYMTHNGVSGCTLVVCPMSLISQWRDEIARFSDLETSVYYGGAKDRRKTANFADFDVIITSYGVLAAEYRVVAQAQLTANATAVAAGQSPAPLAPKAVLALSPLLGTHFWRLVIDEAHVIRSRSTETSRAVCQLRGDRRWAVSGTIIQNKLDDVYAPLHFLREEPWSSWGWWHAVISQPFERQDTVALQRLRAILAPLMLRRTKAMRTLTGESIVELPPRVDETIQCEFTDQEREFYTALYTRSRAQFEGLVSTGHVLNKYIQVLTLLLRLRQCCDHPFLVLGGTRDQSDKEFEDDINRFIHRFASRVDLRADGAPSLQYLEAISNDLKKSRKDGGDDENEEGNCSICLGPPETPVMTECAHRFCRECITPLFNARGLARCPLCRSVIDSAKLFLVPETKRRTIDPVAQWQHSSKTTRLMSELRTIRDGPDTTVKVLIFSQWTSMLDLVEIPLRAEGFTFLRLDGSLTQRDREQVLRRFANDASARIMLISLKAGGVGLNLVSASVVFLVDSWWNPAVEEQACQRVHRIGQTKTVYVKRLIVVGSVEERILELQAKKQMLAQSISAAGTDEQKQVRMQDLVDLFRET